MEVRIMNREISYSSNRDGLARVAIRVEKGQPIIEPSPLDLFLTARFRLYSVRRSTLLTAKVAHPRWPLNSAQIAQFEEGLRRAANLPFEASPALCHHSDGVDTRIGPPIPVSRSRTENRRM
jgi:uncharacterized protein YqjF (DUF2071 family)